MTKEDALEILEFGVKMHEMEVKMSSKLQEKYEKYYRFTNTDIIHFAGIIDVADALQLTRTYTPYEHFTICTVKYKGIKFYG